MPRARYLVARRMGTFGLVLTAWDVWRRIPRRHRKRIYAEMRKHAPSVARALRTQARRARAAKRSGS